MPAFQASILFSFITARLRAWLFSAGASRLVSVPIRSKRKAASHLQASLEEAVVRRPGREAGIKNDDTFERRRCGTVSARAGLNTACSGPAHQQKRVNSRSAISPLPSDFKRWYKIALLPWP